MDFFRYWLYKLIHPFAITLRRSSGALGDNLLLTCMAREIKRVRQGKKIIVETTFPEMFTSNPHVDLVVNGKMALSYFKLKYIIEPDTKVHLIDQLLAQLPYAIKSPQRSVDYYFSDDADFSYLALPEKYIVINPSGKKSHSANRKEWGWEKFRELRKKMDDYSFVQIGDIATPLIEDTLDYRGRSITESAWIIKNALTCIFLEGGLMHLADSVNRPSVIIYGGVVDPDVSGYNLHLNVATKPHCSPCFTSHQTMDTCSTMECMAAISVERVHESVKKLLSYH